MQAAGYYTGVVGKWGIGGTGAPFPAQPLDRGFDEFYGFMRHGAAHEHYPGNNGVIFRRTAARDQRTGRILFDRSFHGAREKVHHRPRLREALATVFFSISPTPRLT